MTADHMGGIREQVEVEVIVGLRQKKRGEAEEMAGAVQVGLLIEIGAVALLLPAAALQPHGMVGAVDEEEAGVEILLRLKADEAGIALYYIIVPPVAHADQLAPSGELARIPFLAENHVSIEIQDVLGLGKLLKEPRLEIDRGLGFVFPHRLLPKNARFQARPPSHTLRGQLRHALPD